MNKILRFLIIFKIYYKKPNFYQKLIKKNSKSSNLFFVVRLNAKTIYFSNK